MKKKVVSAIASAAIVSGACAGTASASSYTVQKGDSLSVIALKYHTSVQELKKVNNLSSDLIRINQVLQIGDTSAPPSAPAAPVVSSNAAVYTIVKGDTLSRIARQHGISLADLKQWNNLTSDLIYPGQPLKVSAGNPEQSAPAAQPASPSNNVQPVSQPTAAPANPPAPAPSAPTSDYVVQGGDTLSAIAVKHGTTVLTLKQLNGLNSDLIFVGQTLKVAGSIEAAPVVQPAETSTSTYVVQNGDTLGNIAVQFGVTVSNLKKLNNIASDLIFVGQKLQVSGQEAPAEGDGASSVVSIAQGLIGTPYVWGGSSNSGFDCSGFIYYVFNQAGHSIGRYSSEGYANRSYEVDEPVPGDLVFFKNTYKQGISHMGIYLGNHQFLHSDEKKGITISSVDSPYYQEHFDSFKRFY